ncbi:pyridoxal kinase [Pokkaliibacter plantistimulans]|uniref:pyridoxal kinase n=1 Tax=Pokkaliibacter plantistimulans TaxID=1635171 RepID=A0ABX5M118_9GAMM|nr:pyridoxine/pyridoxal/pyridoxamine kinase [Pokkaliibacter plantistimulans]PXF30600.1 pyridoxal kinase [Pokkaliibacter plantistimulans]
MAIYPHPAGSASRDAKPLPLDVVSVQSQVVYGRVGNNVALPTLHSHGLNATSVPTVLFSNTPHYPSVHGGTVATDWFNGFLRDLIARDALSQLQAVLCGYLGSPAQATLLARWLADVRLLRPQALVIIDPVLGDHDCGNYVAPGMVDAYRQHLLQQATGLTPNGYELACLTGLPTASWSQVQTAARQLLQLSGAQWVVVTSAAPEEWQPGEMWVAIVTPDYAEVIRHPRLDCYPKGTGDLFCASLTARLLHQVPLHEAVSRACDIVLGALQLTASQQSAELLLPTYPLSG